MRRIVNLLLRGINCIKNNGLVYTVKRVIYRISKGKNSSIFNQVTAYEFDYTSLAKLCSKKAQQFNGFYDTQNDDIVDIIIPVFNGYEILLPLLNTVDRTNVPHRLIIINDCSTDERIDQILTDYKKGKPNTVVINNSFNCGYIVSVNKGLSFGTGNAVLLNTDVRLPDKWLERLIYPVRSDSRVATATPFTNSGTICSFPAFCKDNSLFMNMPLDVIDAQFSMVKPWYETIPTGVGFCMAISRKALDEVGLYDADTYGMGYAEENDWCQRAIKKGYKNVLVENLFVYHQHGATFSSEEKKRLIESNHSKLLNRHPMYDVDVSKYCERNPHKNVRAIVAYHLIMRNSKNRCIVAFDHGWGGGATMYLEKKQQEYLMAGYIFIVIRFVQNQGYVLSFNCQEMSSSIKFDNVDDIFETIIRNVDEIWVNEFASYPKLHELIESVLEFADKSNAKLRYLFHDYYSLCPTINLLDDSNVFCEIPNESMCMRKCRKDITSWRAMWARLFASCDELIAFSQSSKAIIQRAYPELTNIQVIPHALGVVQPAMYKHTVDNTINICVIGVIDEHKGAHILEKMCEVISRDNLSVKIRLVGYAKSEILKKYPCFSETGQYKKENLRQLVEAAEPNIVFLPSICPETFSYTLSECMEMELPVAVFNIGAQAERCAQYSKGLVISHIDAQIALNEICKTCGYPY